ncbi:hypothetical protein R80B4_02157 [Fibrobacteres bacterium R8-0-B4]
MPLQHRDHLHAEPHLRRPEAVEDLAPEQMPPQALPPIGLSVPVRFRYQRVDRVVQPAAHELDRRAPETLHEVGYGRDVFKRLADPRILKLFEQRAGDAQVQPGDVLVAFEHTSNSVVTPHYLLSLPPLLGGVEERQQVSERLVKMQTESVVYCAHTCVFPFLRYRLLRYKLHIARLSRTVIAGLTRTMFIAPKAISLQFMGLAGRARHDRDVNRLF